MKIFGYEFNLPARGGAAAKVAYEKERLAGEARQRQAIEVAVKGELERLKLHALYSHDSWNVAGGSYQYSSNHPVLNLWDRTYGAGMDHYQQMHLFHILRIMLPVLASSFKKRRQLEGFFYAASDDEGLNTELQEFIDYFPVGNIDGGASKGVNAYLNGIYNAGDEFGLGLGEPIFDETGRHMEYLSLCDTRTVSMEERRGVFPRFYDLYQMVDGRRRLIAGPMVHRASFRADGTNPWPAPLVFGLQGVGEVVIRMLTGLNNMYIRAADPSYLRQIVYDKDAQIQDKVTDTGFDGTAVEMDRNLYNLQKALAQFNLAKLYGMAADISFSLKGGEIKQEPLMSDPESASVVQFLKEHYEIIAGEIIDASDVPPWMFTIGNNQSEGIGSNKAQILSAKAQSAARQRRKQKGAIGKRLIDLYLLSIGAASSIGRYTCDFEETNMLDEKLIADTDKLKSESAKNWLEVAYELYQPEIDDNGMPILTPEMLEFLESKGVIEVMQ